MVGFNYAFVLELKIRYDCLALTSTRIVLPIIWCVLSLGVCLSLGEDDCGSPMRINVTCPREPNFFGLYIDLMDLRNDVIVSLLENDKEVAFSRGVFFHFV